MEETLKENLRILLKGYFLDNDLIDSKKVLISQEEWKNFYEKYKNSDPEIIGDSLKDVKIEDVKPYFEKYNIKRFWFKDTESTVAVKDNEIVAFQDGVKIILKPGDYINGGEVDGLEENPKAKYQEFVYVYFPQKINKASDNFYIFTQGNYLLRNYYQPIIRYYFSLKPIQEKVSVFVEEIKNYLNDRKIPFQLKTPYKLNNFNRSDTLVLYVAQNHYFYLQEFIKTLKESGKEILRKDRLPLFVRELYTGIGFAEDPYFSADSFGEQRCKLTIEAIQSLSDRGCEVSINTVINYFIENGYNEIEFYRNPYTKFDYKFENLNEIVSEANQLKKSSIGKLLYLKYNGIALDYALDLIERAIWLDEATITWFSYDKEEQYRILKEEELYEIYWFLDKIIKINSNRKFFPTNIINLIENKINALKSDEKYNDTIDHLKYQTSSLYDYLIKNNSLDLTKYYQNKLQNLKNWSNITTLQKVERRRLDYIQRVGAWMGITKVPTIKNGDIYKIAKEHFKENDMFMLAERLYRDAKIDYPIQNEFGNYEYCPTSQGKLQVAMIMMFVYCPSLYDEFEK